MTSPTEEPDLAARVSALETELARERAIRQGRTTPPTTEEIAAHSGYWLADGVLVIFRDLEGWCVIGEHDPKRRPFRPDEETVWLAMTDEARPTHWPGEGPPLALASGDTDEASRLRSELAEAKAAARVWQMRAKSADRKARKTGEVWRELQKTIAAAGPHGRRKKPRR